MDRRRWIYTIRIARRLAVRLQVHADHPCRRPPTSAPGPSSPAVASANVGLAYGRAPPASGAPSTRPGRWAVDIRLRDPALVALPTILRPDESVRLCWEDLPSELTVSGHYGVTVAVVRGAVPAGGTAES